MTLGFAPPRNWVCHAGTFLAWWEKAVGSFVGVLVCLCWWGVLIRVAASDDEWLVEIRGRRAVRECEQLRRHDSVVGETSDSCPYLGLARTER